MGTVRGLVGSALLVVGIAACSLLPGVRQPTDAVRGAVAGIVAHDLAAAAMHVCPERLGDGRFPFSIQGITGVVDGLSFEEGFALIRFDASDLSYEEERRDANVALVSLSGTLVEFVDPARYEAAYRDGIAARGEPMDQPLFDQVIQMIGNGRYELEVDQSVRVVLQNGVWQVCEPAPTP